VAPQAGVRFRQALTAPASMSLGFRSPAELGIFSATDGKLDRVRSDLWRCG